jgi:hypothetical protein
MSRVLRIGAVAVLSVLPTRALAAPSFEEIAREFTDGLVWLNAEVAPALADDGTVVFAGSTAYDVYEGEVLFSGDGGALSSRDPASYALSNLRSLRVNAAGTIAFVADRAAGVQQRGVYRTSTLGSAFATVYEAAYTPIEWPTAYVTSNVALSENGTVAFATIREGGGAIYRGPVLGPLTQLRTASGIFYNVRELDVNDAGTVPVQMEYTDPTNGLSRGILLFDAPEQTLADIDTAIERLSVGMQPYPAINGAGQVAFALASSVTLKFFDPPGVYSDPPAVTMNLSAGVYVSTPTPWGEATEVTLVADTAGPYASFGKVDINDSGLVVFEATLDDGGYGIFTGPNPALHKVVAVGDVVGSQLFSWLRMGQLNNDGELSLLTSDYNSTDRQVWRVGRLPRPARVLPRPPFWPRPFPRPFPPPTPRPLPHWPFAR